MNLLVLAAFALLALGVVGSALPAVPGASLSVAGLLVYWWQSGYAEPGPALFAALLLLGLLAMVADWFGGALSAKVGGASLRTTAAAAIVGLLLLPFLGPLGVVLGVAGTVFALEFYANGDAARSGRAAAYATVGMLASSVVQVLLTGTMLVAMALVWL